MRISDWSSDVCSSDLSLGRGCPSLGGLSEKSGGTTRGDWRCTANSSGRSRLNSPVLPQPDRRTAPVVTRKRAPAFILGIKSTLRGRFDRCLGLFARKTGSGKDNQDAGGGGGIG